MSRGQRGALLAAMTVALAVIAFVVLKPDDDEKQRTQTKEQAAKPQPKPKTIQVKRGSPAGGVAALAFRKGERVRFSVSSDAADEVHVHGYDLEEPVAPGKPASFSFPARIEGVFEVELHSSHQPAAELEVKP